MHQLLLLREYAEREQPGRNQCEWGQGVTYSPADSVLHRAAPTPQGLRAAEARRDDAGGALPPRLVLHAHGQAGQVGASVESEV